MVKRNACRWMPNPSPISVVFPAPPWLLVLPLISSCRRFLLFSSLFFDHLLFLLCASHCLRVLISVSLNGFMGNFCLSCFISFVFLLFMGCEQGWKSWKSAYLIFLMVVGFCTKGVIFPLVSSSVFAPDVTVRALLEGIQHVFSPSRNIRNPRNLNFFYFPTIQQDHALSLLIAPFRQLLAAEPAPPVLC